MRILVFNTDYGRFQGWFARQHPELAEADYATLEAARYDTLFGKADFYPRNFRALGHESQGILGNNIWLQNAWAREHGMKARIEEDFDENSQNSRFVTGLKRSLMPWKALLHPIAARVGLTARLHGAAREILLAQVEEFKPDVILNQDMDNIAPDLLKEMKCRGRVIIGQCGTDAPPGIDLSVYDFAISLIPWVVEHFRARGLPAAHRHLAFDPSVLERLGSAPEKDVEVSFVGSIASQHSNRVRFLEALAQHYEVALWLPSPDNIPFNSSLRSLYRGNAWGRDMYNVIRRSKVTLNFHADFARGTAGNMRLYEATGVGTCLMTDNLRDLPALFGPNREVLVYDNVDNCVERVGRALRDDAARETMASAGQVRTLTQHTYRHRAREILEMIANPPQLN